MSSPDSEARRSENREGKRLLQQHIRRLRAILFTLGASPGTGDEAISHILDSLRRGPVLFGV